MLTWGWLGLCNTASADSYTTRLGETREIALQDGSQVHLNTRTSLEFDDGGKRRVVLHEGEAFFEVVPDVARPFRVELAHSEIRVMGAQFNVYQKRDGDTVVTVIEGTVEVDGKEPRGDRVSWQRELQANQQIVYGSQGVLRDVYTTSTAASAVKWREGILEIRDEPLSEVLEELSRYTDQRIQIRDRRLKQIRVVGAVSTRDVRAALVRLEKLAPITVTEEHDTFTLDYRERQ